VWVCR